MFRYDVFPARAVIGDRTFRKARLLVTADNRAVLYADLGAGAEIVAQAVGVVAGRDKAKPKAVIVTVNDDEIWEVTRTSGCGCGGANASLKRINRTAAFA